SAPAPPPVIAAGDPATLLTKDAGRTAERLLPTDGRLGICIRIQGRVAAQEGNCLRLETKGLPQVVISTSSESGVVPGALCAAIGTLKSYDNDQIIVDCDRIKSYTGQE